MEKKKKTILTYGGIFVGSILVHWLLVYFSYRAQGSSDLGFFKFLYERFANAGDASHYLNLAENGYPTADSPSANIIVFYPLYPWLVRLVQVVVRNYFVAALLVSQVTTGIASIYMYKLLRLDYEEKRSLEALVLFWFYPFAIFTFGVFSEGVFLMCTIMTLYYIRLHKWPVAGVIGCFAALSRVQGMLLLAPAIYEYITTSVDQKRRPKLSDLCMFGIPLGFVFYLILNKVKQGDCFIFLQHEAAEPWYQTTKWINENLAQHYDMALQYPGLSYIIYWVQIALYFIGIGALLYGVKHVRTTYVVYGGIYMCMTYLSGWMISGGRYMMGCIPLYLIYASVEKPFVRRLILASSVMLMVFFSICFMQGQAIM